MGAGSQIKKLKECFASLDDDGGGSIGVEEIQMPLIGLGLVDTIEDVEEMVLAVDEDGSGNIEFPEFLDIVKNKNGNEKTKVITEFFQALTNGQYSTKDIAFPNYVLELRRKHLKDAIMKEKNTPEQIKGAKIMRAVKLMLDAEKEAMLKEQAENKEESKSLV